MGKGAWLGDRDRSRPTETESDRDRPRPIETDRDRKPETLHIPTPHLKPTASVAMWAQSCFAQAASARMDSAGSRAAGADLLKEADLAGLMAQRAVLDGGYAPQAVGKQ